MGLSNNYKEEIQLKLNLVIDKLMKLGTPENEANLEKGGEAVGFLHVILE